MSGPRDPNASVADYPRFKRGVDSCRVYFERLFRERIVIYDGAMGTMIQKYKLSEEQYRVSGATASLPQQFCRLMLNVPGSMINFSIGGALRQLPQAGEGQQRHAYADSAGDHQADPQGVPAGRCRPSGHQHLLQYHHRPGGGHDAPPCRSFQTCVHSTILIALDTLYNYACTSLLIMSLCPPIFIFIFTSHACRPITTWSRWRTS